MNALATTLCAILAALFPSARPKRVRTPSPPQFLAELTRAFEEFNHLLALWRAAKPALPPQEPAPAPARNPRHCEAKPLQSSVATTTIPGVTPDSTPPPRPWAPEEHQTDKSFLLLFFKKEALPSYRLTP
jgi:hypothetical protein